MEQKNKQETGKRKCFRILFALMILCGAAMLLGDLAAWVIHAMGGISFSINHAASIGIIGGADGPTSVLIASSTAPFWHIAIESLILLAGILGWCHLKRK